MICQNFITPSAHSNPKIKELLKMLRTAAFALFACFAVASCGGQAIQPPVDSNLPKPTLPQHSAATPAYTLTANQVFSPVIGDVQVFRNGYGDLTYISYENPPAEYPRPDVCPADLPLVVMHFTKNNPRAYHFSRETWFVICQQPDGSWISPKSLMIFSDGTLLTLEVTSGIPTYQFVPPGSIAGQQITVNSPYLGYFFSGLFWTSIVPHTLPQQIPWTVTVNQITCPVTALTNGTEQCISIMQQENCPGPFCDTETWYYAPSFGPVEIQPQIYDAANPVDPLLTAYRTWPCGQIVNGVKMLCPTMAP